MQEQPSFELEEDGDLLLITFRGRFHGTDVEPAIEAIASVVQQSGRGWLTLTDYTDANIGDADVQAALVRLSRSNAPFVRRGAVLGSAGMRKFLFDVVQRLSGRQHNMRRFETREEALAWLRAE